MVLKKFTITMVGLIFFFLVGLQISSVYSATSTNNPAAGAVLPSFELKGPASPQTKAYLGVKNEKQFPVSQIQGKLLFIEFYDVY